MLLVPAVSMYAQNKSIEKADKAYKDLQYQVAIANYVKACDKLKDGSLKKHQVTLRLAECYRLTNNPDQAAEWYGKIVDSKFAENNTKIYIEYADALRTSGNYKQAEVYYNKYLQKQPTDFLAKAGLRSCQLFEDTSLIKTRFIVKNLKNLNTLEDDYSPSQSSKDFDQVFFSSNRQGSVGKDRENWTGAWFSDILMSTLGTSGWSSPVSVDANNIINTECHEATPSFNKSFQTLYFTRCEKAIDKKVYCQVMKTERQGKRWSKPVTVLSENSTNIGQPCVSKDELVIYFASDRKGGSGGKDIWMATRTGINKPFKDPVNVGLIINTPGDEMFPYLKDDTILYFSSTGHAGLGGLDIFRSVKHGNKWDEPENLKSPVNSINDDFGIVYSADDKGYFTSNRAGGAGGDDIYSFEKKNVAITLSGTVKDEKTLLSIPGINVSIVGQQEDTIKTKTDQQGKYYFDASKLREDNSYKLMLSGINYLSQLDHFDTSIYHENTDLIKDYQLSAIPSVPIVLPDILYELNKWDVQTQYQDSLKTLIRILVDNPNLAIELRSHTDSRATSEYNDELSQKRAQSVVDFLVNKGIDPGRLTAKGYGKRAPRLLDKDVNRGGYLFKMGTLLDDAFIGNLPGKELKESAFELNRRTEFIVIAKDYQSSKGKLSAAMPVISIVNDSLGELIPFIALENGVKQISVQVNDFSCNAIIDPDCPDSYISGQKVLELMQNGALTKDDFTGDANLILANDQVTEGAEVRIKKLRIGGKLTENISLVVKEVSGYSLKLGKDVLGVVGSFHINPNSNQIIFK